MQINFLTLPIPSARTVLWVVFVWLVGYAFTLWCIHTFLPLDSTDAADGTRSGFTLLTDHGTGCEYLKHGNALTVRIDAAGRHICRK